ncbi:glycosyltransferase [Gilliamella sp. Pas-s25]|uniref:glycosyltransferase n=1 Tax=Gilliamella sp. Pas-s25 TaxID=2687310 RepID=UPI00135EC358|nr:glycosyltransferase [Gilliamella sp. Pas-s25]MWP62874.1 glycosyltransferase [Gilliamella sp. Pas-s25]
MIKRIASQKSVKIKFLGITIYKRNFNPREQYFLKKILVIKKDHERKTVKFLGFNILTKKQSIKNNILDLVADTTNSMQEEPRINQNELSSSNILWFTPTSPQDQLWNDLKPAKYTSNTKCVVILPVYKGLDETLCSIYHALKSRISDKYSLLVINDAGPDEKLNIKLNELSKKGLFDYHLNEQNLGFVKTINFAISNLSHNLDVILLNSDAFVFEGWFERMIDYADKDETIATITPMSNNATICSYPFTCQDNNHNLEISPEKLDKLAAKINKGFYIETPTGVGFCFYMRRKVINQIGMLDDISFKVGYGEENDFCMRAIHAGFKNIIIGDVFVYHVGSVSFSAIKAENMKKGENALKLKHPNYLNMVHNFINIDPVFILRRNLDVARLKLKIGQKKSIVIVTHAWDGGINTYLEKIIGQYTNQGIDCILLKVHDKKFYSIYSHENDQFNLCNLKNLSLSCDFVFLDLFFKTIQPVLVHINSFAGLDWHHHQKLLSYFSSSNLSYKFIIHDYACMSYDYKLLNPEYRYEGVPSLRQRNHWYNVKAVPGDYDINTADAYERHKAYASFLKRCFKIESPSYRARDIVLKDFPNLDIDVIPHDDGLDDILPTERKKEKNKIKIASIGALSIEKGSQILSTLAIDSKNRDLNLSYFLVGFSNPGDQHVMKTNNVTVTGKYKNNKECIDKIREISPDLIILPSIWEETFSYTLSIALALKIPTLVFDIGAQSERTKDLSWVVKLDPLLINNPRGISDLIINLNIDKLWDEAREK